MDFQNKHSQCGGADGIVGPNTWAVLFPTTKTVPNDPTDPDFLANARANNGTGSGGKGNIINPNTGDSLVLTLKEIKAVISNSYFKNCIHIQSITNQNIKITTDNGISIIDVSQKYVYGSYACSWDISMIYASKNNLISLKNALNQTASRLGAWGNTQTLLGTLAALVGKKAAADIIGGLPITGVGIMSSYWGQYYSMLADSLDDIIDHSSVGTNGYICAILGADYAGGSGFHGSITYYDPSGKYTHTIGR